MTPAFKRFPASVACAVLASVLTCWSIPGFSADVYYTGGNLPATSNGDNVLINGSDNAGLLVLSNSMSLNVTDWINTNGNMNVTGKNGLTFKAASAVGSDDWAVMEYTGGNIRIMYLNGVKGSASGTQTIEFDKVVFKGGKGTVAQAGVGLDFRRGDLHDNELIINGDVAFVDNRLENNHGAAIYLQGSLTFTGTTIFDGNASGWDFATNTFAHNRGGAAIATADATANSARMFITFDNTSLFMSNTGGGHGGAIFNAGQATYTFNKSVIFEKNTAGGIAGGSHYGGAVHIANGKLAFNDSATFIGNKATGQGGALNVGGTTTLVFGGFVTMKSNTAGTNGGAIQSATPITMDNVGYLLSENTAQTGGAIFTSSSLRLNGSGTFSENRAGGNGGAIVLSNADGVIGSGAYFIDNVAGANGGAIYMSGSDRTLTLSAQTDDIIFKGNKHGPTGEGNAIYMAHTATLTLDAAEGQGIYFYDQIANHEGDAVDSYIIKKGEGSVEFDFTTSPALASQFTGNVIVEEGVFSFKNDSLFGVSDSAGALAVKQGATLAGNGTIQAGTVSIESGAVLEVMDGGRLSINTANAHVTGADLVLAGSGTIQVANTGALNAAKIRVGDAIGSAQSQTLSLVNDLTLANGAVLQFDLDAADQSDSLLVGNITLPGTAVIDLTWFESGSFNLITWAGAGLADTSGFTVKGNGEALTTRNNAVLGVDAAANTLYLTNEVSSLGLTWTGADAARIWKSSLVAHAGWNDNGGSGEKYFTNGDSITFGAAGQGSVSLDGNVVASEMNVTGGDYAFGGTGGITVSSASVLSASAITGSGTSGRLVKSGAGALVFSNDGDNLFEEGVEMGGGMIAYQSASHLGVGAGKRIDFTGSGTLRADAPTSTATGTLATDINIGSGNTATFDTQSHAVGYAGALSGADATVTFAKAGSGELILHADNSAFTGTTRVLAGSLMMAANSKIGGMTLVGAGAAFGGSGSAAIITTTSGATVQSGIAGTASVLSASELNLAGGSILKFNLLTGTPDASTSVNSRIELASGNVTLFSGGGEMSQYTINLSNLITGRYDIGTIAGLSGAYVTYGSNVELSERQGVLFDTTTNPGRLHIIVDAGENDAMLWTGSVSALWATGRNWFNTSSEAKPFIDGDVVVFQQQGGNPQLRAIDINNTLIVSDMRVDDALDYRFHGDGGITADAAYGTLSGSAGVDGKLKKAGAGALIFENTGGNVFMGGIEISGGSILFSDGNQLATTGTSGVDEGISFVSAATLQATAATELASSFNVAGGVLATLQIDSTDGSLVWSGTFAATSTGTLVKTGNGTLLITNDSSAHTGHIAIVQGDAYLGGAGAKLGGTVDVAAGSVFGGIGEAGGVAVAEYATLRVGIPGDSTPGTLTVTALEMRGGSRLEGSGTLAGTGVIGGMSGGLVNANIGTGDTLTITAALSGSGTLTKSGAGDLVYGSDAALGHAATQVNEGVLMLRNITAPDSISHSIVLNGGWLDLSETDVTTNDWTSGLRLSGETGMVIGKNDVVSLGAGAHGFQIGGAAAETQGIYVVVDAGSGTAVLTGTNTYAGLTRLKSGVLAVSSNAQLGSTALNRDVVFEGGSLYISEGFTTQRLMDMSSNGAVEVAEGMTASWGGVKGAGALTKTGLGALTITGTLENAGGVTVSRGVLRVIGAGSVFGLATHISNSATVDMLYSSGTMTLAGSISGDTGTVNKSGGGLLVINDCSQLVAGTLNVREGSLELNSGVPLVIRNQINTNPTANVFAKTGVIFNTPLFSNSGTLHVGKAAGGANHGEVRITGDYHGYGALRFDVQVNEDLIVSADRLVITGSASGQTKVYLNFETTGASGGAREFRIIDPQQGIDDAEYSFYLGERYVDGAHDYTISPDGVLSAGIISPELPLVLGVDAATIFMGKASLDSLANRMSLLRFGATSHGYEFWVNGLYRTDRLSSGDYEGTFIDTMGVQTGVDARLNRDTWKLSAGVFYDYVTADMRLYDGKSSSDTTSHGVGAYLAYSRQSLYMNAVFRASKEDHTIEVPETPSFDTDGSSYAGAFEIGYSIKNLGAEEIVPYARVSYQRNKIDDATDSFERTYTISRTGSLESRAGVRIWQQFDLGVKNKLIPHFGVAVAHESKGESKVTVDRGKNKESPFRDNHLDGVGGLLEAGAALRFGNRCAVNLHGTWYLAEKTEFYSINLEFRYLW